MGKRLNSGQFRIGFVLFALALTADRVRLRPAERQQPTNSAAAAFTAASLAA